MVWCRMKRRFTLLGYGIAAALAVGCESIPGIESYSPLEYGSEAKCRTTSSCPSDTVCIAGRCASASGAPYDVALKLTYPDAVDKPFTRYLEFTPGESLGAFELPDPVVGNLSVWYEGRQVEGTATFTQHGAWNGAENAQSFVFSAQKSDFSIYPAVYDIVFTPAQSRQCAFRPRLSDRPRSRFAACTEFCARAFISCDDVVGWALYRLIHLGQARFELRRKHRRQRRCRCLPSANCLPHHRYEAKR